MKQQQDKSNTMLKIEPIFVVPSFIKLLPNEWMHGQWWTHTTHMHRSISFQISRLFIHTKVRQAIRRIRRIRGHRTINDGYHGRMKPLSSAIPIATHSECVLIRGLSSHLSTARMFHEWKIRTKVSVVAYFSLVECARSLTQVVYYCL